jgi:hypothetical protein
MLPSHRCLRQPAPFTPCFCAYMIVHTGRTYSEVRRSYDAAVLIGFVPPCSSSAGAGVRTPVLNPPDSECVPANAQLVFVAGQGADADVPLPVPHQVRCGLLLLRVFLVCCSCCWFNCLAGLLCTHCNNVCCGCTSTFAHTHTSAHACTCKDAHTCPHTHQHTVTQPIHAAVPRRCCHDCLVADAMPQHQPAM